MRCDGCSEPVCDIPLEHEGSDENQNKQHLIDEKAPAVGLRPLPDPLRPKEHHLHLIQLAFSRVHIAEIAGC